MIQGDANRHSHQLMVENDDSPVRRAAEAELRHDNRMETSQVIFRASLTLRLRLALGLNL